MWLFGRAPQPRTKIKRRHERFNADSLTTPIGEVQDISVSGVRIAGKGRTLLEKGRVIPVRLQNTQHSLHFMGRVAWIKKNRRGFEAGIHLLNVKPLVAEILRRLGEIGFVPVSADSVSGTSRSIAPPKSARDPYQILGIEPSATDKEIQTAYRRLALQCHPDANTSPEAAVKFARITEAHRSLQRTRLRASA